MKLLRFLLYPFAILYDIITGIRNWCFDVGILKVTSFDIPVIAVGNLSVGGTGKTPQIEYLIRLLKDDFRIGVLSRGYKRKTEGFIELSNIHNAEDVGDEPLQFFKKFGNDVTIAVDADRTNGIQQLLAGENPPKIVLLDDAYQHRKVKADTYILLTKYGDLYTDDFILPTGNLRESRRGAKRADFIVVTKCPSNLSLNAQEVIRKKINAKNSQKVFFTTIFYDSNLKGNEVLSIDKLKDREVVLVTGIASPKSLLDYLNEKKVNFTHIEFPDHHDFSTKDLLEINESYNRLPKNKRLLLTTEKDYVRLVKKIDKVSYISIKISFLNDSNVFDSSLIKKVSNKY